MAGTQFYVLHPTSYPSEHLSLTRMSLVLVKLKGTRRPPSLTFSFYIIGKETDPKGVSFAQGHSTGAKEDQNLGPLPPGTNCVWLEEKDFFFFFTEK